jgi:hypothetical protein
VRGSSAAAVVEEARIQYGPEERGVRLRGDAKLTLAKNRAQRRCMATTIDLDRISARRKLSGASRGCICAACGDRFSARSSHAIPMRLAISAEAVTLAGGRCSA